MLPPVGDASKMRLLPLGQAALRAAVQPCNWGLGLVQSGPNGIVLTGMTYAD